MATSSPASSMAAAEDSTHSLLKKIRSHEVSIAELAALSSSRPRAVYQKNGNIFFRTSAQQATASEQQQLDTAKAKLQKLNLASGN
ncbi:uncharacterized protein LOC112527946 [Cynara cardunculus var. scolymus]|uniref:Prefoldin n=1 Tax=Cynara cardunculus var. scolymus TaxID=59895 RepID=A0A103XRR3_CYNCS|nr:uncharacterized protein LOC112527946 [Cynara cardunculus var. scolymus]KVH95624.1 hypothetical protein Ccrd_002336 [Cynara cardunculus var. scolymus]